MKENIKKNNERIKEFKEKYYSYHVNKKEDNDSVSFQLAIIFLALFMLAMALVCKFMGNMVVAAISYVGAIIYIIIPVVISVVKLYILGGKRIQDQNRIEALDKTFEDYLGKGCDYSRQLQLIDAIKESYSQSSEGILVSITKIAMFILTQVAVLSLSLLSSLVELENAEANKVYIWIAINIFIALLDKFEVVGYLFYNDLLLFISRDYRKTLSLRIFEES